MSERELSCFFVRELFPLYVEGNIDASRKSQIETHLADCKDCKNYYEKLEAARNKISTLSATKVSPAMVDYLKQEHHFWKDFSQKLGWGKWPTTIKWAIELTFVTIVLISTVHFFPWLRFARLVNRMRPRPQLVAVQKPEIFESPAIVPPREKPQVATVVESQSSVVAKPPVEPSIAPASAVPSPVSTPTKIVEKDIADHSEDEEGNAQTAGVADGKQKAGGFVWRGSLKVDELNDDVAARVTKVILDLGGTKAGQVELGWHRGKQRYYHFILPEENYEKFLSVLNREGIIQLTQERNPRTIKEGHMRIIMTIEENEE
jgi:hypothetical protein